MKRTAALLLPIQKLFVFVFLLGFLLLPATGKPAPVFAGLAQDTSQSAAFPGGRPALMAYLEEYRIPSLVFELKKKNEAIRLLMEVEFQVQADGSAAFLQAKLFDIQPNQPEIKEALRQEWIRFFRAMPKWKPALKNGVPVASRETLTKTLGVAGGLSWEEYQAGRPVPGREPVPFSAVDLKTRAGKQVYAFVQKQAAFPGGEAALKQYLIRNIPYLRQASQINKGAPVVLVIVVNERGVGEDILLVRPRGEIPEQQASQAIRLMPVWTPGRQGRQPVPVAYTFPVEL